MTRMRPALLALPALALAACGAGQEGAHSADSAARIAPPAERPADATPWQVAPAPLDSAAR